MPDFWKKAYAWVQGTKVKELEEEIEALGKTNKILYGKAEDRLREIRRLIGEEEATKTLLKTLRDDNPMLNEIEVKK